MKSASPLDGVWLGHLHRPRESYYPGSRNTVLVARVDLPPGNRAGQVGYGRFSGMWRSLVSAPALGAGGREFESRHPDQTPRSQGLLGTAKWLPRRLTVICGRGVELPAGGSDRHRLDPAGRRPGAGGIQQHDPRRRWPSRQPERGPLGKTRPRGLRPTDGLPYHQPWPTRCSTPRSLVLTPLQSAIWTYTAAQAESAGGSPRYST